MKLLFPKWFDIILNIYSINSLTLNLFLFLYLIAIVFIFVIECLLKNGFGKSDGGYIWI